MTLDVFKSAEKYSEWAPLVLRVVAGFFFLMHGLGKFVGAPYAGPGMEGWTGMMAGLGFGTFFAYLVPIVEVAAGTLLILGLLTRYATIGLAIIVIVAAILVKFPNGFLGAELDLTYLAVMVALFFTGPGKWGLDKVVCKDQ